MPKLFALLSLTVAACCLQPSVLLTWSSALSLHSSTLPTRLLHDHRAGRSRLIAIYKLPTDNMVLVSIQPVAGGRELQFKDGISGEDLGHIGIAMTPTTSSLTGMFVSPALRGSGLSSIFLSVWLSLCSAAGVKPGTSRIRKPLMALALMKVGFKPVLPGKGVIEAEVGRGEGDDGFVDLYCKEGMCDAFKATELKSQKLRIIDTPIGEPGRNVMLRARYEPPVGWEPEEDWEDRLRIGEEGVRLQPRHARDILMGKL